MGLDIKVLDKNNEEIDLKQNFDDDDDMGFTPSNDMFEEPTVAEEGDLDGYTMEDADDEDDLFSAGAMGLDDLFGSSMDDDSDETM